LSRISWNCVLRSRWRMARREALQAHVQSHLAGCRVVTTSEHMHVCYAMCTAYM
jgi:hypothetical protein